MNKRSNIILFMVICFGVIILLAELYNLRETIPINLNGIFKTERPSPNNPYKLINFIESFKTIAFKHGTDKVTTHHYEYVYGQLIGPFRFDNLNFLEIGLGCGMGCGPGKSIPVWKEYMPNANVSILEFNEACARPFESQVKSLFIGDQSDLSLMKRIGEKGGQFDIIVDDGGHTRKRQINSLIGLWPFLRNKGGIYIIEDIFTSFINYSFNDNVESTIDVIFELIILFNDPSPAGWGPPHVYPQLNISKHSVNIKKDLMSINCFERACALIKK